MTPSDEIDAGRALAAASLEVVDADAVDHEGNELPSECVEMWTANDPRAVFAAFERELRLAGYEIVRRP